MLLLLGEVPITRATGTRVSLECIGRHSPAGRMIAGAVTSAAAREPSGGLGLSERPAPGEPFILYCNTPGRALYAGLYVAIYLKDRDPPFGLPSRGAGRSRRISSAPPRPQIVQKS